MQKFNLILLTIFLFISSQNIYGRIWKYDILINDNTPYCDVVIQDIIRDSVVISGLGSKYRIAVDDISWIIRERESRGTIGMIIGGLLGIFSCSPSSYPVADIVPIMIFSGFGGLIGVFVGADEEYDFSCMVYEDKIEFIKWLIRKKKQRLY
jgi:dolichol kinase